MKIGELARQAGCPVETVRYYEREGLLPMAQRDESNNYRSYDKSHLERLMFIRRCRALDMTHSEIRSLLDARAKPEASCESINELIDAHLAHVQARVAELKALEAQLAELRAQCHVARATCDCGILRELDHSADVPWSAADSTLSHVAGSHCTIEPHPHHHHRKPE
jgi:Cd(II)/Pb(II)-responsive transcriptional regulator